MCCCTIKTCCCGLCSLRIGVMAMAALDAVYLIGKQNRIIHTPKGSLLFKGGLNDFLYLTPPIFWFDWCGSHECDQGDEICNSWSFSFRDGSFLRGFSAPVKLVCGGLRCRPSGLRWSIYTGTTSWGSHIINSFNIHQLKLSNCAHELNIY